MIEPVILLQILWTGIAMSSYYVLLTVAFALTLKVEKLWNFAQAGLMGVAFDDQVGVVAGVDDDALGHPVNEAVPDRHPLIAVHLGPHLLPGLLIDMTNDQPLHDASVPS